MSVVFGTGREYENNLNYIKYFFDVVSIVDNSYEIQATTINDIYIQSRDIINSYNYDYVLVTPIGNASLEIKTQLEKWIYLFLK